MSKAKISSVNKQKKLNIIEEIRLGNKITLSSTFLKGTSFMMLVTGNK